MPIVDQSNPGSRGRMSSWAIVLIVLGGCALLFVAGVALTAALMFPVFGRARSSARSVSCLSNLKQISLGLLMYTQDYDETLPPAQKWQSGEMPYVKNQSLFACSESKTGGYAFNRRIGRLHVRFFDSPALSPMVFDSTLPGPEANDLLQSFDARHSSSGGVGGNVGFADGHVKLLRSAPGAADGLSKKAPPR